MKKIFLITLVALLGMNLYSQEEKSSGKAQKLPSVDIKTLDGKTFNTKDIQNDGKPIIISLWATWCKPCIQELMAIADVYDDWVEETGVILYAISVDDSKSSARVAPFVNGKAWDYDILLDVNQDFQRAMSVNALPFLCILNGDGEIVWKHTSYAPGSEEDVYEVVKELAKGKK